MSASCSRCNQAGARLGLALALLVATWLMLTPAPPAAAGQVNDKLAHLLTFAGLAFLAHAGWPQRGFSPRLWLPLLAYGLAIEGLQYFVPGRSYSLYDWLADASGLALYGLLAWTLGHQSACQKS